MFFNSGTPVKARRFEYQFRYYKPEEDKKKRIEFHRVRKSSQPQRGPLIRLILMFLVIIFVLIFMGKTGFRPSSQNKTKSDVIKVEEIIVID